MTIKKFSKSSGFYIASKSNFFESNEELLNKSKKQNKLYASQPLRNSCKICNCKLPTKEDFISHDIKYKFCKKCNHLNGIYKETQSFVEHLYVEDDGREYAKNYKDEDYLTRTKNIYTPKVEFLETTLEKPSLNILDVGSGAGYFVLSCLQKDHKAKGIDLSNVMVDFCLLIHI